MTGSAGVSVFSSAFPFFNNKHFTKLIVMKIMTTLILFLALTFRAYGPENRCLYIETPAKIQPYEAIWKAICLFESNNDPYAYHMEADGWPAVGIAQIRWCRLKSYNELTGHKYQMRDMYDPQKSKQVFMYFANEIGPYDLDRIVRNWNGSGPLTYKYLKQIKNLL